MSDLDAPVAYWPAQYTPPTVTGPWAAAVPVPVTLTEAGEAALAHDLEVDASEAEAG